jgi:SAM-dependent methyltransferase
MDLVDAGRYRPSMIYENPLAYILGLHGVALLRSFAGDHDREFVERRLDEVRQLVGDETLCNHGVMVDRVDTVDGYRIWSDTYDEPGNSAFDFEEPIVHEILDTLPAGTALDAACGTGRHSDYLAQHGHAVIGVDSSADMLARARERVPSADFRAGELHELPIADDEVDLVVCALALTHVADLVPVLAEFARVLRPGGHLVISDMHQESILFGNNPPIRGPRGERGRLPGYRHFASDYLSAALPHGFQVRRCEEPRIEATLDHVPEPPTGAEAKLGPWESWPWSLTDLAPAAARAARSGSPATIIWHFQHLPIP